MKRILLLVVPFLLSSALAAPASAAKEWSSGSCADADGVTLVVQFDAATTVIRCLHRDPTSGYDALTRAGFSITPATNNGGGAICKIDGYPSDLTCTSMPPADHYWAYFRAAAGGSWAYSRRGGAATNPAPGTVEGWRFQSSASTTEPSTAPPRLPVATPNDEPSRRPTTKPRTPRPTPAAATSSTATATPTATATSRPGAGTTTGTTPAPTPTATEEGLGTVSGTAESAPTSADDDSSTSSWIVGLALLLAVGGAGAATALRRRRG